MTDLFAIHCTTCKTRLRVRDAAVIGQILACPKCSSMVLVEPPPGWQPPAANPTVADKTEYRENAASQTPSPVAVPKSAPATLKAVASKATSNAPAAARPVDPALLKETVSNSEFGAVDDLFKEEAKKEASTPSTTTTPPRPSTNSKSPAASVNRAAKQATQISTETPASEKTVTQPAASQAAKPNAVSDQKNIGAASAWPAQSRGVAYEGQGARRRRMLAMLAIAGCAGVGLAIGAASFFARYTNNRTVADINQANSANEETSGDTTSNEAVAIQTPDPAVDTPTEEPDAASPSPDKVALENAAVEESTENNANPEEPATEVIASEPSDMESSVAATNDAAPAKAGVRDPLDLVDEPAVANAEPNTDPLKMNDLRKLTTLLPNEVEPISTDVSSMEVAAEDDTTEDSAAEKGTAAAEKPKALPRPPLMKVDVAARLADRIVEIEFDGQSLAESVQFLSDFSTIPITIEPEALVWSKITPATLVKAKVSNAPLSDVLAEILKPFRLEGVNLGDQLLITRSSKMRSIKSPVDDLTAGDADKRLQLVALITDLAAPSSWKGAGGEGTITVNGDMLVIENTELAYGEVMQICERLRIARGNQPKSVFPPELFSLTPRTEQAAKQLNTSLTLNFGQPTSLVKILNRLAKDSGTMILIDWRAAAEVGWSPTADATVTLVKTPLREALPQLLAPMDLTYRVIDARTIQITTTAALRHQPEIEVHSVAELAATPEEAQFLIEKLLPTLGEQAVLRFDDASKSLFALLPQPKQIELAQALETMREK